MQLEPGKEYTILEVATWLGRHRHTVWRAVDSGQCHARWETRFNCWMIKFEDMLEWREKIDGGNEDE